MNPKKILFLFLITALFASVSRELALAEEEAPPSEDTAAVLKSRQDFNKLRLSSRNIYKVTMRSGVVYKLQTAIGYVSTIDLPEKALKVFIGDQELFKVGVYETQILIKPVSDEKDARTNLVIVTASGRLAFDVSVGAPEAADFVLDFRLPENDELLVQNAFDKKIEEKHQELEKEFKEKEKGLEKKADELSETKIKEKITAQSRSVPLKASQAKDSIQINLLSLSQVGDKAYLRFSILNYSKTPYKVARVFAGVITEEKRLLKKRDAGRIELQSELSLQSVITPDSYVYGVLSFDFRSLGKNEKPVFKIEEEGGTRAIEIQNFAWLN